MVEIEFGTFLHERHQDGQGTAAAMGEIEAIELFSGLGHSTVMVAGCGQGCPRLTFRGLGILVAVAAVVSASGAPGVRVWPDYVWRPKTTRGTTAAGAG